MSAMLRLQWSRYPTGFGLFDDREDALRWPEADLALHRLAETYVIGGTDNAVVLRLANVKDAEDARAFARDWGFLSGGSGYREPLARIVKAAPLMREAVAKRERDPGGLDGFFSRHGLRPSMDLRFRKLKGDSAPVIGLEAHDLLQFCVAELLLIGSVIRKCPRAGCGNLFMQGTVGQQRAYCSPACRVAVFRARQREVN
jgi:hypothetical protein